MDTLAHPLADVLAWFYKLVPSYAVAIILLTISVMVVLLPLTIKGTRSMLAMQRLGPEIKKLQQKHQNDRAKLNEEMAALYKDNQINPLSGCLPLILQLPVFFVLYRVISGVTHHDAKLNPAPMYLSHTSKLYKSLIHGNGQMKSLGIDLAKHATSNHHSFGVALPFYLLVVVNVSVQYWQQHQVASRASMANDTAQARQMRTMQKLFPPVFGVISLSIPAGVMVYWVVSSLFRVGQQWAMYRFDPRLKATVEAAKQEAERFLAEGKDHPRAQKRPQQSKSSAKRKRKGR